MWGFVLIAGTFSWLTLLNILKTDTHPDPDKSLFVYDEEHDCGMVHRPPLDGSVSDDEVLVGEATEWKSFPGKGRRAWVGEILAGLSREDRTAALRFVRAHQQYLTSWDDEEWQWLTPYRPSFPVSYYMRHLPEGLRKRLLAPVVWLGGRTFQVSYAEWAEAVREWYQNS